MVDREEMAREQDADLRELAELGMSFARKLEARVDLVTNVAEAQALALAFNRIARGVRLTHALRAKLVRDHQEIARLDRTEARKAAERRKAQITAVLDREIFTDHRDQDDADELSERLTERLEAEALFDDFLNGPIEAAVTQIRKDIGLPELLTSPVAAATAGGGPSAEERMVEGASDAHRACGPPPPPPALRSARPAVPLPPSAMGEVRKKPGPS